MIVTFATSLVVNFLLKQASSKSSRINEPNVLAPFAPCRPNDSSSSASCLRGHFKNFNDKDRVGNRCFDSDVKQLLVSVIYPVLLFYRLAKACKRCSKNSASLNHPHVNCVWRPSVAK
ncbi:uncharacterized protein EV154DRAFT_487719 [Mucor mucedo]|uniref:uncharacterized protein n=1 Tax=Mucor mucedo TaxID=29922 RepID=UPI00221F6652|nr:uncharacterized protein EV154DRAFT_487719 [Mucor mucedo]KAI7871103.1 hypothetical protein EV154DRAFT_487719 [Mucor mucedo]